MPTNETRLMHYVPRVYLKKFTIDNKTIFGIRKNTDEYFKDKVDNVCAKNHLYRIDGETVDERQTIENFYRDEIENHYSEIYATLTDQGIHFVTDEMREKIISFIISLFYRNYSWYKELSDFAANNLYMQIKLSTRDLVNEQVKQFKISEEEINSIIMAAAEKVSKEGTKPIFNKVHIRAFSELVNLRMNDNIMVKKIEGDYEFVTSDCPILMHDSDNINVVPFNLNNSIVLPIDSKHYVKLMRNESYTPNNKIFRNNYTGDLAFMESLVLNASISLRHQHYILGSETSIVKFQKMKATYFNVFTGNTTA